MSEGLVGALYYDIQADGSKAIRGLRETERAADATALSFNAITKAVQLLAGAYGLLKLAKLADEMRLLEARVTVAAGSIEKGAEALDQLRRISQSTQTELSANVGVFNRLNRSIIDMGGTQADTLRITELLGKAVKVSGASAPEAASAMTQFGQALGSGKLAGDELRSLLENAPYLMQQLAKGLGVPIGALKQLGEDGKLTAEAVTDALGKAAADIESDFAKLPKTFSGAMTQVADAGKRAAEKLDDVTGSSAALTGVAQGTADILDAVATQLAGASTEADKLGRNDSVKTWAEYTRIVLTYVVDAADFVARGFRQVGTALGGLAAAAGAAARGELRQASDILATMKDDVLAIGGAKFAGQAIRESMAAARTEDRGFTPNIPGSKLNGAGGKDKDKRGDKFDALAYLGKLRTASLDGIAALDAAETEALRKNQALLAEGKISRSQAAEAQLLIEKDYTDKRQAIQMAAGEAYRKYIEDSGKADARAAQKAAEDRLKGQQFARSIIGQADPRVQAQFAYEDDVARLQAAYELDQENFEIYAQARLQAAMNLEEKLKEINDRQVDAAITAQLTLMQGLEGFFSTTAGLLKRQEGEQSSSYKALFAIQKGFSVASSMMAIYTGASKAWEKGWPAGAVEAAAVLGQGASLISTLKGLSYGGGRMSGGMVGDGTMVRINEAGRPEMFTASNGSQWMLPTSDGKVTAAGGVGAGGVQISVHNYAGAEVTTSTSPDGRVIEIAVRRAVAEVVDSIDTNSGPVMAALRRSTNVQARL